MKALNQKNQLIIATLVNSFVGIAIYPVIARNFNEQQLHIVMLLIFVNALFGAFDVLKPVLISNFNREIYSKLSLFNLSSFVAITLIPLILSYCLFIDASALFIISVLTSFYFYILSSVFWAMLDISGKVGTAVLIRSTLFSIMYIMLCYISFLETFENIYFLLPTTHFLILVVFICLVEDSAVEVNFKGGARVFSTLTQNSLRAIIDFTDRLFISKFLGGGVFAYYSILADLANKTNLPIQLTNSYMYPKICTGSSLYSRLRVITYALSGLLLILSLLFTFEASHTLLVWYGGRSFEELGNVFSLLIAVASLYSFAFTSQSLLRAKDMYVLLNKITLFTSLIGLLMIYPLFLILQLKGVILAVLIMKSNGIIGILFLDDKLRTRLMALLYVCFLSFIVMLNL